MRSIPGICLDPEALARLLCCVSWEARNLVNFARSPSMLLYSYIYAVMANPSQTEINFHFQFMKDRERDTVAAMPLLSYSDYIWLNTHDVYSYEVFSPIEGMEVQAMWLKRQPEGWIRTGQGDLYTSC